MKNSILTFLLIIFLTNIATAQFQSGESFVSGSFFNNLNSVSRTDNTPRFNAYNHYINLSVGKFVRDNRALGWGLTHSLSTASNSALQPEPTLLRDVSFGIERFAEYYKSLNDKFALYARPALNLGYAFKNSNAVEQNLVVYESKINTISISAGISAGVVWRVSPKWALYGGFAFLNPISIGYEFSETENFQNKYPNGENVKSTGNAVTYAFSPNLSSGSIGLGFRYFYGGK
jgi:hypothetical protein